MTDLICPTCGEPFSPKRPQGGGSPVRFCSRNCRWKAKYQRQRDNPENKRRICQRHGDGVLFIYSPEPDGWPTHCAFPMAEVQLTLRLGYFPVGAKFRFKRKIYTVCGHKAVTVDGEVIA